MIETERLRLRKFDECDLEALHQLLSDAQVNPFLPWFTHTTLEDTRAFYEARLNEPYFFAICRKEDNVAIGYVKAESKPPYDFGYALRKEFWHQGIVSEASLALVEYLRHQGLPYMTATHDVKNPRSGHVMKRIGMKYAYTYEEWWMPKEFTVAFRMYQMDLNGHHEIFKKYWNESEHHWVEEIEKEEKITSSNG